MKGDKIMTYVIDSNGNQICFDVAVQLMDDEIRETLHNDLAPCSDQEFFTAYEAAHLAKYGEPFIIN